MGRKRGSTPSSAALTKGESSVHFEVGSLVEVQTDEKDFVDVFFSATVIGHKHGQIYVQYNDLLAREGGTDLLKEHVDVSFVRPIPPQEIVYGLSPDDVVEAYYNDGWWTGVVKRVVKGGERFRVKFQTPPDEREFPLSNLRVHWDWIDGNWSRPSKQAETASVCEIDGKVEVSRDSKTHYSWFRSTICRRSADDGTLLVKFSTLKDSEGDYVRGIVDPWDVRPCPPHFVIKPFALREEVEAYFDYGWWSGVVSNVIEGGKYVVFVAHVKTDKVFRQTELRPHMVWEAGKWITSSKFTKERQNTTESSTTVAASGDRMKNSDGNTSKSRKHEKSHPVKQNPSKVTPPISRRRKDSSDSREALSRTLKRHKESNVVGEGEQDKQHDSSVTKMTLDSPSPVTAPLTAEDEDQSSDIHSGEKTNRTEERQLPTKQNGDKGESPSVKITTQISQGKEPSTEVLSSVFGGSSRGAKGHRSNRKQNKQPDHVTVQELKDTPSDTQASSHKRKREKQPKEVQTPLKASKNGNDDKETAQSEIAKDGLSTHETDQHIIAEKGEKGTLTNDVSMLAADSHQLNPPTSGSATNDEIMLATDSHQPNPRTSGSATKTTSPNSSGETLVNESMDMQPDGSTERGSLPVDGQTLESQVEGEKLLVPYTPTNGNAPETTSPKHNGEKLVNESMGRQLDGSTEGGSKPVGGQTSESQVEGKKADTPTNGSAAETTSPNRNREKPFQDLMGLQADGSTGRGSIPVDGQTFKSQVEGEKSIVPYTPTNGSTTGPTSPKCNGEKLVEESIGLQADDGSTEGGSKPFDGQTSGSQVEGMKSLDHGPTANESETERTSPKSNEEKLVKESVVQQSDGSSERESKPIDGQTFESEVEGKKSPVPDPSTNGSATESTSLINNGEKLVSMVLRPDELPERGSMPVADRASVSQVKDAPGKKTIELIVLDGDEDDIMEEPCNVVDDKPQSYSIEGVSSAPNVGEIIKEAETKASVLKRTKTGKQSPNSTEKISVETPDEQNTLPFVKHTSLWETIESMEVFKRNPQKPHFEPLKQHKEGSREGMAIGYMVNFYNVIEKVSTLQCGDPEGTVTDILDTLYELEEHGFDVVFVRDRVVRLLALGEEQSKLVVQANELKKEIGVHIEEKSRIGKEASEMFEELRRLQEKAAVAQLALDNEKGKIAALQARLAEAEQGIGDVERVFVSMVSSEF